MDDSKNSPTLKNWGVVPQSQKIKNNIIVECGWGRLIFANTFTNLTEVADTIQEEDQNRRDIAFYVRDPHLVISHSPDTLFIDPSSSYRLNLKNFNKLEVNELVRIRKMEKADLENVNTIYKKSKMIPISEENFIKTQKQEGVSFWVAEFENMVCGACLVLEHHIIFKDPENGCSLWSLAIDPTSTANKAGITFMTNIIKYYQEYHFSYMDVSVIQSNKDAENMYRKLGFERTGVFCVKRKNAVNETLYINQDILDGLNPYSKIIANEARKRGIAIKVLDYKKNVVQYSFGGQEFVCWESLSELTSSIAMIRCQYKNLTHELLGNAGLNVPKNNIVKHIDEAISFFKKHKNKPVVIKPVNGEQGKGVCLNLKNEHDIRASFDIVKKFDSDILIENFIKGDDLRIVVINYEVVAASVRIPAKVTGDGVTTIEQLIKRQSRRRASATDGESQIPIDQDTHHILKEQGYTLTSILESAKTIQVRKAANLHQGGIIQDVTEKLHPKLAEVAIQAAKILRIPVVGFDFIVNSKEKSEYTIIEANERPGLANHEPQPTAEKFIDLLFPNCPKRVE